MKSDLGMSTYKVTDSVNFAPYLNSFKPFEIYLTNFTTNLNSSHIFTHFYDLGGACVVWGRFNLQKYTNYHKCSNVYNCRLSWQYRRKQEVTYLEGM